MKILLPGKLVCCFALILFSYSAMQGQYQGGQTFPRETTKNNYHLTEIPPGTVRINDSLFCDETELGNIHYREYLYWVSLVYGSTSKEYYDALPDTGVWTYVCDTSANPSIRAGLQAYVVFYFRHPAYDFYPLVGISQKQAERYSKWRADRVLERMLIEMHKISEGRGLTKETCFTIERYFNGTLKTILPGEKVKYYPDYTLPTIEERKLILATVDSFNKTVDARYNKHHKKHPTDFMRCRSDIESCTLKTIEVTAPVKSSFIEEEYPIYNLRGNVAEWTAEKNVCAGGGWMDKRAKILQSDTAHLSTENAWTGFRNVCVWRKWEK